MPITPSGERIMFYIEPHCPICNYGTIGFRMCSDTETIVLMCDECDSVWLEPTNTKSSKVLYPRAPDFKIPGLECSIKDPDSHWAYREEISKRGWEKFIMS